MNTTTLTGFSSIEERIDQVPTSARRVIRLLKRLKHGTLSVQWPDDHVEQFGQHDDAHPGIHAHLHLRNWKPLTEAIKSGDIGFAESYIAGDWSTNHLADLLQLLVANRRDMEDLIYGHWLGRLVYRVRHLLNRNTKANSAKNIHAHYDLGNPFYTLWLDPTMNYSSAWFNGNFDQPMSDAQNAKVRRALEMTQVKAGDRVMEIGCGWGALAEMGGREFGAHMSGVTLSSEQLSFAKERMQRFGLQHNCDLRLQDYRDINDGPYDAICSIEMVEAVGQEYWPTYFSTIARLLKTGGRACVQSIVIDDALFDRYVKSTDFIQQYIFPGGCLPSPSVFRQHAQAAGLKVVDEMCFGLDYAETLRRWHTEFQRTKEQVLQLGFDDRFCRIWEFYLAYCEAAFEQHNIDVMQFTLEKA